MNITADQISSAVITSPIQPLFNTLGDICRKSGVGIVITNTETLLSVECKVSIGSAAAGTVLTDAMFTGSTSTLSVSGFAIENNVYFSFLELDSVLSVIPNEMRTDAAGLTADTTVTILKSIGLAISEKLLSNIFTDFQALTIAAGVPAANMQLGQAGLIQWNPLAALGTGQSYVYTFLDTMITALPLTMQAGGSAGDLVVAWVNHKDFATLKNSVTQSYQQTVNGGFTTNYFQYVKSADTISESRSKIFAEFIRYKNLIIRPLNGLVADTIFCTYQEGIDGNAPIFTKTIPATDRNNFYFAIKGAFEDNIDFVVPIEEAAAAISDLPYQVGHSIAINKSENYQSSFKVISNLGHGLVFRELDKVFAVFPGAAIP